VTFVPPSDPDHASSFLNIRVADIGAVYEQWSARGAEFLTPPLNRGSEIRWYLRDPLRAPDRGWPARRARRRLIASGPRFGIAPDERVPSARRCLEKPDAVQRNGRSMMTGHFRIQGGWCLR
jgi:hypothetical protein